MSGNLISMAAEALVAVLLVITIGYCILLNSRLKRLRADESDLRATISELVTATEIAERAIGGLKAAALDCDKTLSNRMREAEHFSIEIAREIAEGQKVLNRIKQIATAVRKTEPKPAAAAVPVEIEASKAEPVAEAAPPVALAKLDVRSSIARLEEAVTAKLEEAGNPLAIEAEKTSSADVVPVIQAPTPADPVALVPVQPQPSRNASRIEELRVMAEQARERLKELRKVNTEKAA
jgi:hypothetical protein